MEEGSGEHGVVEEWRSVREDDDETDDARSSKD